MVDEPDDVETGVLVVEVLELPVPILHRVDIDDVDDDDEGEGLALDVLDGVTEGVDDVEEDGRGDGLLEVPPPLQIPHAAPSMTSPHIATINA